MTAKKASGAAAPVFKVADLLPERQRALIQADETAVYHGPCVVQAPGGWTRVGPTWQTRYGWIVVGPGVLSWGTTQGIAELAAASTATPKWHAVAAACAPAPNLVLPLTGEASEHLGMVAAGAEGAEL